MKHSRKTVVIVVIAILALFILTPVGWFVYTRFLTDRYSISIDWSTVTFKGETYVPKNRQYETDAELQAALDDISSRIGKDIGIAVFPSKRSFTDLIWPVWVYEYDGDTSHREIFVRGLMDVGNVYVRQQ